MPPKKKKFESTFPAARIKKIMQLDDDVGRVASSVPVVISRAVEIFLHTLLTRAEQCATSRNAKTLSVSHLKHCIEQEKQWDFLKELTAKIPNISADVDEADDPQPPRRGRKRQGSPGRSKGPAGKRKAKGKAGAKSSSSTTSAAAAAAAAATAEERGGGDEEEEESSESSSTTPEPNTAAAQRLAPDSTLASTSTSGSGGMGLSGQLDQYHRTKQHLSSSGGGSGSGLAEGPLSIPALIAAGSGGGGTREEDSDDDYD